MAAGAKEKALSRPKSGGIFFAARLGKPCRRGLRNTGGKAVYYKKESSRTRVGREKPFEKGASQKIGEAAASFLKKRIWQKGVAPNRGDFYAEGIKIFPAGQLE